MPNAFEIPTLEARHAGKPLLNKFSTKQNSNAQPESRRMQQYTGIHCRSTITV